MTSKSPLLNLLYVALGGFLGTFIRIIFLLAFPESFQQLVPWTTLTINCIGSFGLAYITYFSKNQKPYWLSNHLFLFLGTGVFGVFTSFSSLIIAFEAYQKTGNIFQGIFYLVLSLLLGLLSCYLGTKLSLVRIREKP